MQELEEAGLIMQMIGAAATGDPQRAAEILERIAESRPSGDMFPVCCAVAAVGKEVMVRTVDVVPPFWTPTPSPGESKELLFARRFVAAWANNDEGMCRALYGARDAEAGYALADAVCALVVFVGKLGNDLINSRR